MHAGVVHRDTGGRHDVARGDRARTLLTQVHGDRLVLLGRHDQTLEVQDDGGDIFFDAGHGGELVQHAVDADAGDGRAGNRRQQRASQRIAQGVTESGLQRFDDELGPAVGEDFLGQCGALRDQHGVLFLLLGNRYLMPLSVPFRRMPARKSYFE